MTTASWSTTPSVMVACFQRLPRGGCRHADVGTVPTGFAPSAASTSPCPTRGSVGDESLSLRNVVLFLLLFAMAEPQLTARGTSKCRARPKVLDRSGARSIRHRWLGFTSSAVASRASCCAA